MFIPRVNSNRLLWLCLAASGLVRPAPVSAQSTQSLISGYIRNQATGEPVAGAHVIFESVDGKASGEARSGNNGAYSLPPLAPGTYRLEARQDNFQPREYDEVPLAVAAFLEIDFELRPLSDVFEQDIAHNSYLSTSQRLLNLYGPDIDTSRTMLLTPLDGREGRLTISVSDVIDPAEIEYLPLTGRDIYTTLLLQPGVNADPAATRGLGFSVNGQRPSSSNFLLDGVETSDYLISGPLVTAAPEAIQEYRVSTNNFSAEFGGTSGYIANAVTQAAGPHWHGLAYLVGMNSALNANGFQENLNGYPRAPIRSIEPGVRVGGPVRKNLIFVSNSFDFLRLRTRLDPQSWLLPTAATVASSGNTETANLLKQYPAVEAPPGPADAAETVMLAPTNSLNQYLGLSRLDGQTSNGLHHFLLRAEVSQFDRPDYYWTPYTDFITGFRQSSLNIAAGVTDSFTPHTINESRVAWGTDLLVVGDNNHGLPQLSTCAGGIVCLPSSTSPFAYNNNGLNWQALDNFTLLRADHTIKVGAGLLHRSLSGYIRDGADGSFDFTDLAAFLADNPFVYTITVARTSSGALSIPDYERQYEYTQFSFFAEDSWRLNDHLALSYGIRYENFGAPVNTGSQKDYLIALGRGSTVEQRIKGASASTPSSDDEPLYDSDHKDWAPRFGVSWVPWRKTPIVLRGSYGIFYDRPFDNLWQTIEVNSVIPASTVLTSPAPYLAMARAGLSSFPGLAVLPDIQSFQPTLFQPGLRNPMVQSAFAGAQSRISDALTVEANLMASHGRRLLTTDFINRDYSQAVTLDDPYGRINPNLPPISYRANQGFSNYDAASVLVKFNTRHVHGQIAYTWNHSIDNQSDPIAGDFNLQSTSVSGGGAYIGRAAFVQQFNSGADRGNSDFDQRNSLVFFLIASLPAPAGNGWAARMLQGWQVAGLGSLRSGLPFNAYADLPVTPSNETLIDDRADVRDPVHVYTRQPVTGGVRILNPAAFCVPADGLIGNAGRNAFAGPGTISANLSVSRSFHLPRTPESMKLTIRADAYNVLNHSNLYVDSANPVFPSEQFGTAQFGTTGVQTNFPVQVPLTASPREVLMGAHIEF